MKARVLLPLYLFFLLYRLLYWGVAMTVLPNVYFNAAADSLVSYLTAYLIFRANRRKNDSFKNKVEFAAFSSLFFLLACAILWGIHFFIYSLTGGMDQVFRNTFNKFTFQFFDVITLLFIGASISFAWFKNLESRERAEQYHKLIEEKRDAELKFLKAQINPHFIFNTLNAINFSINKENQQARTLVSDFADLFRFQLYESDQDFILLESELEFIEKFIKINEVRMSETYRIEYKVEGNSKGKYIPPLLLIPFIENSFKHAGNIPNEKARISFSIKINEKTLYCKIENTIALKTSSFDKVGGVGLSNVKRRLNLLFSNLHKMDIQENKDFFQVYLEIPLKDELFHN